MKNNIKYIIYFIIIITMVLITISFAKAENISATLSISITNNIVTLDFPQSGDLTFVVNNGTSMQINHSFSLSYTNICDNSAIQSALQNISFFNYTDMERISNQEVSKGIAAHQDWLKNTFMKNVDNYTALETQFITEKYRADKCEATTSSVNFAITTINQTCDKRAAECTDSLKIFQATFALLALIVVGFFAATRLKKMRENRGV